MCIASARRRAFPRFASPGATRGSRIKSRPLRALAARRWAARPSPGTFRRRRSGKPVLDIVPGLRRRPTSCFRDWAAGFGFGLYNYLHAKSFVQNALASTAPKVAEIGRNLSASTARTPRRFMEDRCSATVQARRMLLHALLEYREHDHSELLVGHSKGRLCKSTTPSSPFLRGARRACAWLPWSCPIAPNVAGVSLLRNISGSSTPWDNAQHVGKPAE